MIAPSYCISHAKILNRMRQKALSLWQLSMLLENIKEYVSSYISELYHKTVQGITINDQDLIVT